MENIFISFDCNTLKLTHVDKNVSTNAKVELSKDVIDGPAIVNADLLANEITKLLGGLKVRIKNPVLHFLTSPEFVYSFFMTFGKDVEDIGVSVLEEARKKLIDVNLDDIYFSYIKIAPFVYQFVGVKKDLLEAFIQVSNTAKIPVQSVVPSLFLFPKILPDNDPSIFVMRSNTKEIIALSEFNAIYYAGLYEDEKTTDADLEKLVSELSVYKRVQPIKRVFTLDYNNFNPGSEFKVSPLPVPINGLTDDDNYKLHILFNYIIGKDSSLLLTSSNLLNLLPVPAVSRTPRPVVYAGALAIMLVLAGGLFFSLNSGKSNNSQIAEGPKTTAVLGNTTEPKETTPSKPVEEKPAPVLNKKDLKVRVENGASIAGIASKTQNKLEELGYVVTGIGNAEEDRENTLVKFKTSKINYKELITTDLKADYELVIEEGLPETEEYDVLVVLGKN